MISPSLDDFDRRILALLRDDGRLTSQELATLIGLSASQCSRRRIALEQAGLIIGYHAQIAPQADETPLTGVIEVRLARYASDAMNLFLQYVREEPAVRDVLKLTGDHDYLIKVAVMDLAELNRLITHLTGLRDCIANLRTSVVLERVKENGVLLPPQD